MSLTQFQPMPLGRVPERFSHPYWLFEIKWDGFRALLHSDKGGVRLVSRNGNVFKSFPGLCDGLARDLKGRRCLLDGEIVCLDSNGKSQFRDLLFRRAEPFFYVFDLLRDEHAWSDDVQERRRFCNGEDVRYVPLCDRKLRLRQLVRRGSERLLYCDHIEGDGEGLFRLSCENDLEGIVAKHKYSPYLSDAETTWLKIRIALTQSGHDARNCLSANVDRILMQSGLGIRVWRRVPLLAECVNADVRVLRPSRDGGM